MYLIDIGVMHFNCTDYDVQLVNGSTANEGKVLICINGVWGTLCDDYINNVDAGVICTQLGYRGGTCNILILVLYKLLIGGTVYTSQFPNSHIPLVTDISCSSQYTSISQCSISHFTRTSSCDADDIAAVRCHSKNMKSNA